MIKTFSPKTATPTVEDTGTTQLVNGVAVVRLDSVFAATIDPQASYRVFLTPGGDSNGLYVAQKTAAGFLVRESKGGRSTLSFDYRIVATAIGQSGQRMSVADVSAMPLRSSVHALAKTRVAQISTQLHPKLPRAPRIPPIRTPAIPQITLPRPPSQAALAPGSLR